MTVIVMASLFYSCAEEYERVLEEKQKEIFPQGITKDFVLTYTEVAKPLRLQDKDTARVIVILRSSLNENYENLRFRHQLFPEGIVLDFFDESDQKTIIKADYATVYSLTNLIELEGNVVIETHDNKILYTDKLFWDRQDSWIFTPEAFTFENPEDGTVMNGLGLDFNRDFTYFYAMQTYGVMNVEEESDD